MTIPLEEIAAQWLADPEVQREYDALAPEFDALAESHAAKKARAIKSASLRSILKTHPDLAPEP